MELLYISPLLLCCLLDHGVFGESVSGMEGDPVTLHTGVETNQQEKIRWYFKDSRIAQISGDLGLICTDVQCKDGDERFRNRLKLDHQTGSLTITNTRTTDSGLYQLKVISSSGFSEKIFNVTIYGVSAAERNETKAAKEGESVTLHPGKIKKTNDCMMWYFKDILIAEITGDPSKTCTDDQSKERYRDRLQLDHQTGSLTITNTRTTDSGDYTLQIISSRFSISRRFIVSITTVPAPGLSSAAAGGICATIVVVLLVAAVVFGIYRWHRSRQSGKYYS
ncbi:uncharacterized protein [Sinocyclocheilus grahami]|uniref:uncharacterized protein n=1 Tax=Sinocyclocheilus grahami TaxID=75366 RepID=UPI0007AC77BA|nr:PREDICTED: uncharacterized protein LOC107571330 [Sinocyclocheilus grahami]